MSLLIALALALALDALLGEPRWLWDRVPHPAVIMGKAVGGLDRLLNDGTRQNGLVTLAALIVGAMLLGLVIRALPLGMIWEVLFAAILLAQRSLCDHVADVATGLRNSLAEGRAAVAHIVGRDVEALDEAGVARAAIESGAENFSDGVIAPAFWFAVMGLPGILAYKVINTADSMIGYRTEKYKEFGRATARMDDWVNWVPARISALLIAVVTGRFGIWQIIWRDAKLHRSPNAGWPEAAMAGALDVALSGPRSYDGTMGEEPFVHPDGQHEIGPSEIDASVGLLWRAWGLWLGIVVALAILI